MEAKGTVWSDPFVPETAPFFNINILFYNLKTFN